MKLMLLGLGVLGMLLMVGQPVLAAAVHEGIVVSAKDDKLTMTDMDGKNEHSHNVTRTTLITLDGKTAKLDELKKGFQVKVTTSFDEKMAVKIEAKSKSDK
jgi:hypothetical protein